MGVLMPLFGMLYRFGRTETTKIAPKSPLNNLLWKLDRKANTAERVLFSNFERAFYQVDGYLISTGRSCNTIKLACGGRDYYVKRYRTRSFWKSFTYGKPMVEYRNLTYFARMGIPVPRIVGYGRQRIMGLFLRGAIITEGIPQSIDLQRLFLTRADLWRSRSWLSQVLQLLAGYVRRIHEDGFTHGDLKWRNILTTTTETPRVFFIDCPSGGRKSPLRRGQFIVKDLAGLDKSMARYLSRTTRLRFFLWYRNRTRLSQEDKALIARVTNFGG
jgi:tRNA A-37 threonylcarbamoyl transferase component Bud32